MKKATKSATTPAIPAPVPAKTKKTTPAAKTPKPEPLAPVSAVKKVAKAPVKKTAAVKKDTTPVPAAIVPPTKAAPIAKAPVVIYSSTSITAQIDVGFGNTLYIRGEGPGLSWELGKPMDCVADDRWSLTFPALERPVVFKFLVNDLTWSTGEDYVAAPGAALTVEPTF